MARISIRDFPDDLHVQLMHSASQNHRSLEGEMRYALAFYVKSLSKPSPVPLSSRQIWQHETGKRLLQLFERLNADGFFAWNERSDLPHLALRLGEPSPAPLMDYVEGREPLPFDLAHRLAQLLSCNLSWLINGTGSMFPYPDLGSSYADFFEPALENSDHTIKMVRLCGGDHDATLLLFRFEKNSPHIAAGYCATHFNLGSNMGGTGQGRFKEFAKYLGDHGSLRWDTYNFTTSPDDGPLWDHHPAFYLNLSRIDRASWKQPLLEGIAPEKIEWVTQ